MEFATETKKCATQSSSLILPSAEEQGGAVNESEEKKVMTTWNLQPKRKNALLKVRP